MKTVIIKLFFCGIMLVFQPGELLYSQNIINTLGSNGMFKIKGETGEYFTISQSNGYISLNRSFVLPNTTSSNLGIIYKGTNRFLHTYHTTEENGYNTFLGVNAGNFSLLSQARFNTGVGPYSLSSLTTGYMNTALGSGCLQYISTGYENTAVGVSALNTNSTGFQNVAIGNQSLFVNSTGKNNTALGSYSLNNNNNGNFNTSVGSNSLFSNISGAENTSIGFQSLHDNTTGEDNTALGSSSLYSNTTGNYNVAVGNYSSHYSITGSENTAIGYQSLFSNLSNSGNTAVGYNSLYSSTGWQNTAVGHHSLQNNTGNYNTAIGYNSGSTVTTGANLTLIGIDANPSSPTANDQITLGNQFVSSLRCNVQSITSLSDARDKKNITELSLGLDFITKLHPRQFNWDKREWYDDNISNGSKMTEVPTAGFIAQELDSAQRTAGAEWLNLVLKDNPEKWEATYGNLLPVMVKAIQELKSENDLLKNKLAKFEEMQSVLAGEIEKMKSNNFSIKEVKLTEK